MMDMFWLADARNAWQGMIEKGIKPQGVIINGADGVGKNELLKQIVPLMLCAKSNDVACGECQSCRLNLAGHHPDVLTVSPENHVVKVAMIRQLTEFFVSTPHCSQHKIAVINQAHLMNQSAANALLKVLEEPPATGTLFLLSDAKHHLLPTIRSRCISLTISVPMSMQTQIGEWLYQQHQNKEDVSAILSLKPGVPLAALAALKTDDLRVYQSFIKDCFKAVTNQLSVVSFAKNWHDNVTVVHLQMWQEMNLLLLKQQQANDLNDFWSQSEFSLLLKKQPQSADLIIKMNDLIHGLVLKFNTQLKKQLMLESLIFQIKLLFLQG